MKLKDTVELMQSESFKDRMIAEYQQTKIRHEKLCAMLEKWKAGTLDFTPACPETLLRRQERAMREYLDCLELRGEIEGIPLDGGK